MMTHSLQSALPPLYTKLLNTSKEVHVPFCIQWGKNFPAASKDGILFVGKATNGWYYPTNDINHVFNTDGSGIFNNKKQMLWVEEEKYYKKSAFWRVIKKISQELYGSANWYDYIAWSNLYKLNHESGNPNSRLRRLQESLCSEILSEEIRVLSPKAVVFLTSHWENFFFQSLNIESSDIRVKPWANRQLTYFKHDGITYIRSYHPERKPEADHVEKILSVMREDIV